MLRNRFSLTEPVGSGWVAYGTLGVEQIQAVQLRHHTQTQTGCQHSLPNIEAEKGIGLQQDGCGDVGNAVCSAFAAIHARATDVFASTP